MPILSDADRKLLQRAIESCDTVLANFDKLHAKTIESVHDIRKFFDPIKQKLSTPLPRFDTGRLIPKNVRKPAILAVTNTNGEVRGGMRRMMIALAQRPGINKRQLGVRAGLSSTSGTFGTYLGTLRSNGWIDGSGDSLTLTDGGLTSLGDYQPLPEGQQLLDYWLGELGQSGAGRMLRTLASVYPKFLTKEELGERAEISHASGTFGTYLGKLRTLELIEGRGELRSAKEFFE